MIRWLLQILLCSVTVFSEAQHQLVIRASTDVPKWVDDQIKLGSAQEVPKEKNELLASLFRKGYLAASFDTCNTSGRTTTCELYLGDQFEWADLRRGSMDVEIASAARFREKLYRDAEIDPVRTGRMMERVLQWCEKNGFPFARLTLDSIQLEQNGVRGVC